MFGFTSPEVFASHPFPTPQIFTCNHNLITRPRWYALRKRHLYSARITPDHPGDVNANSRAIDTKLNQLKPRSSHFPSNGTLFKRQNTTTTFNNLEIDDSNDDDDTSSITGAITLPGVRLGCYRGDSASSRLLPSAFTASDTLTLEVCAIFCGSSSPYFGVEYGRECWCASFAANFSSTSPSTLAARVPDTECPLPCSGNAARSCGASSRIEIYTNTLFRPPSVATASLPPVYSPTPF
ncbi:unnamed protein product [Sordaria macrospora k-hell]|uniref:WGS project CABT00000000 data, contig 2.29 n=1 Tax=Sordaria macrospora (strain ATCC MYA-333 / DSM 997 / K(L3346) / K-hell) TaxID=771870 RepID=F7W4W6_SORMK|nr:uncharacterized protein SMAC_06961 [Sordaria macrospora k-hell]CCC12553.1 unnamed protein product [Sordaria macrospora k-hell]